MKRSSTLTSSENGRNDRRGSGGLDGENQQQRDQQRENAERFGYRETENQATELAVGGGRVADRTGEVIAEKRTQTNARAAHSEARHAGADILSGVDDRL